MRKLFALLLTIACLQSAKAQQATIKNEVDLFRIESNFSPTASVKTPGLFTGYSISEFNANALVPIVLNGGKLVVINQASYEFVQLNYKVNSQALISVAPTELHNLGYNVGAKLSFDSLYITALLVNKIAGNATAFKLSSYRPGGIVMLEKQANKKFLWRLGLFYQREYYGDFYVPFVGFKYVHKQWKLDAAIPISARIAYQHTNNLQVGFRFNAFNRSYLLEYQGFAAEYMHKRTNEVNLYFRYSLTNNLVLCGRAGASIARSYRPYAITDNVPYGIAFYYPNQRTNLGLDYNDGFNAFLGLVFKVNN